MYGQVVIIVQSDRKLALGGQACPWIFLVTSRIFGGLGIIPGLFLLWAGLLAVVLFLLVGFLGVLNL